MFFEKISDRLLSFMSILTLVVSVALMLSFVIGMPTLLWLAIAG